MTIAFIPIRSGSKSIPDKNIKAFCKKPLVYWCLKAAAETEEINSVYVAVDSNEYSDIIQSFDIKNVNVYRRKPENSQDMSQTEDVMLEFIRENDNMISSDDTFVLIQATSPFTTSKDLSKALLRYRSGDFDSMLSAVKFKRFIWDYSGQPLNYDVYHRPLRQQWNGVLLENGSFYINKVKNILQYECRLSGNIAVYSLPEFHQYELDEESDWHIMEALFQREVLPSIEK